MGIIFSKTIRWPRNMTPSPLRAGCWRSPSWPLCWELGPTEGPNLMEKQRPCRPGRCWRGTKKYQKMHGNSTKTWVPMTNRRSHALKMWRCLQPQIPTIRGVQLVETVSHGNKFMLQWRRFLTIPSQAQPWPNHFLSSKQRWNWWKTNGFGWIWCHPPPLNVCLLQKLLYFSAIDSFLVIIHGLGYYP